ncbi:hypothetical protein DFH06DRAFT_936915, partial [Mycena polygramma]
YRPSFSFSRLSSIATSSVSLLASYVISFPSYSADYVVDCVCKTVHQALDCTPSPPGVSQRGRSRSTLPARIGRFGIFVSTVLVRAEVRAPALLVALAYICRLRSRLYIAADEWAYERVFLGALICASKYTSDVHLKNAHWALCTGVFSKHDIARIEREFLDVVEWELGVTEADL